MVPRGVLATAYLFGIAFISILVVAGLVGTIGERFAGTLYCTVLGLGLIGAHHLGRRFHRASFGVGIVSFRIAGILMIVLGIVAAFVEPK